MVCGAFVRNQSVSSVPVESENYFSDYSFSVLGGGSSDPSPAFFDVKNRTMLDIDCIEVLRCRAFGKSFL